MKSVFDQELVSLLRGYLLESEEVRISDDVSLITCAQKHSLVGIAAHLAAQDPRLEAQKRRYYAGVELSVIQRSCEQDFAFLQITGVFEEKGIPYLPVKGYRIRQAYPIPELREMGDFDIVIHPADRERVAGTFAEMGYQRKNTFQEVDEYINDVANFEIHTVLFPSIVRQHEPCGEWLTHGLWEQAQQQGDSMQYLLSRQTELILMFLHMASHFYFGSCGLRFFFDIAVYEKAFRAQIDWQAAASTLQRLGFETFFRYSMTVTHRWFGMPLPACVQEFDFPESQKVERIIWEGGTFGYLGRSDAARTMKTVLTHKNAKGRPGKLLRETLFLPASQWNERYPYLRRCPILYPVAFTHRAFTWAYKQYRQNGVTAGVRQLSSEKREIAEEIKLLHKIGLD